jgi:hypothetical protein
MTTIELGQGILHWHVNQPVDGHGAVYLVHGITAETGYAEFADAPLGSYGELVAVLPDERDDEIELGEGELFVDTDAFDRPLVGVHLDDEPGMPLDGRLCDRLEDQLVRLQLRAFED